MHPWQQLAAMAQAQTLLYSYRYWFSQALVDGEMVDAHQGSAGGTGAASRAGEAAGLPNRL